MAALSIPCPIFRWNLQRYVGWRSSAAARLFQRKIHVPSDNSALPLQILKPVQDALTRGAPVVALESTLVAHGTPYPQNLELCREVSALLRERGVEPATIAIRNGICRVGLTRDELEDLASCASSHSKRTVDKCSTRELSLILARHRRLAQQSSPGEALWGATTVASTMALAHRAGIATFVTGGIGGVHRGAETSLDISADLTELAQTPVIVVSAGIKSILDIPKTLEVLETNRVPVVAYQTNDMPAFFSPTSGVKAPARVDDASEVAAAYCAARDLGLSHGMLVAVPNRDPAVAVVEDAIQRALKEAEDQGIRGRDVTPYVLRRVAETTEGESLRSNMSLVRQNAIVGAEIAIALAKQQAVTERRQQQPIITHPTTHQMPKQTSSSTNNNTTNRSNIDSAEFVLKPTKVVVMGGVVLDTVAKPLDGELQLHTSNPATCTESDGGVGRNVAEALGRLGSRPLLYSAVGDDLRGRALLQRLTDHDKDDDASCGVQVTSRSVPVVANENTASYVAVLDGQGDLHTAMADMQVLQHIAVPTEQELRDAQAAFLVMDANAPVVSLQLAAQNAHAAGMQVFLEPTSVPKAAVLGQCGDEEFWKYIDWVSPNKDELFALVHGRAASTHEEQSLELEHLCEKLMQRMNASSSSHILTTLGDKGLIYATSTRNHGRSCNFQYFPVKTQTNGVALEVANATGAGDSLVGAFLHALTHEEKTIEEAIQAGMRAATISLQCADRAVSPDLKRSIS